MSVKLCAIPPKGGLDTALKAYQMLTHGLPILWGVSMMVFWPVVMSVKSAVFPILNRTEKIIPNGNLSIWALSILIFWTPDFVGFMSWKPKLCFKKQINTWNLLKCGPWIYNVWKFNFLNRIVEINPLFNHIQIFWPGSVQLSMAEDGGLKPDSHFFQCLPLGLMT